MDIVSFSVNEACNNWPVLYKNKTRLLGMEIGTRKCRLNKLFSWEHIEDKPDRRTKRSDVVITARKTGTTFRVYILKFILQIFSFFHSFY